MKDNESLLAQSADLHIGLQLSQLRKVRGITQAELGYKIGITGQHIQKYE